MIDYSWAAYQIYKGYAARVRSGMLDWPEAVRRGIGRPLLKGVGFGPEHVNRLIRECETRARRAAESGAPLDLTGRKPADPIPARGRRVKRSGKPES